MIKADQPTFFKSNIIAAVSSKQDGTMKVNGMPENKHDDIHKNRRLFLEKNKITPKQTVLVQMSYKTDNFTRYDTVQSTTDKNDSRIADYHPNDALATKEKNIALFLPLADCVGAILYDTSSGALMVSHLGRHNTEQKGAKRSVEYMKREFQSQPENISVWLSPAAGKESYPLYSFDNKSLHEVNRAHLLEAGILPKNIEVSSIDTTKDENYHSHSEFLKGNHHEHGRFAIVAMVPA